MTEPKPWYRQFWPWFLMALPASVVVAGLATVAIAVQRQDSLVSGDYYKEGLAINLRRSLDERAVAMQIQAELSIAGKKLVVDLSGRIDHYPAALRLTFFHPLEAARDFTLLLRRSGEQRYQAALERPVDGRWYLVLTAVDDAWRLRGEASIDRETRPLAVRMVADGRG